MRLSILSLAVLLTAACTAAQPRAADPQPVPPPVSSPDPDDSRAPMAPLHGRPLATPTGLRFLIADTWPFEFDLDRRTTRRLTGLPIRKSDLGGEMSQVGTTTVVNAGLRIYAIPSGSISARPIANGTAVAATKDRRGVWVMSGPTRGRCTISRIGLDGRRLSRTQQIDCRFQVRDETALGLIASIEGASGSTDFILRPDNLRIIYKADRIIHVLDHRVVNCTYGEPQLLLTDVRDGKTRPLSTPTSIGDPSYGMPSPDGRWVAVSFDSPAWPGPRQRMDFWLLDTRSLRWHHVPSMPVPLLLKSTGQAWTADNRLVLLGTFDATADNDIDETFEAVATYRPGDPQLSVRRLTRPHGTGSFVVSR